MKLVQILMVGAHQEILKTILRLINANPEWNAIGAESEAEAIDLFKQKTFDLVLIGAGIQDESEMKKELMLLQPDIVCIDHYGGGSGLLTSEIIQGLEKKEKALTINNK